MVWHIHVCCLSQVVEEADRNILPAIAFCFKSNEEDFSSFVHFVPLPEGLEGGEAYGWVLAVVDDEWAGSAIGRLAV